MCKGDTYIYVPVSVHLLLLLIPPGQIGFLPVRQDLEINVALYIKLIVRFANPLASTE